MNEGTPLPGQPMMPTGANAAKYSQPANLMPPMPTHGARPPQDIPPPVQPAPSPVPTGNNPAISGPMLPPPSAPANPPFKIRPQSDGTLAVVYPTPDGGEVIGQVLPKPKVPRAFQQAPPIQ